MQLEELYKAPEKATFEAAHRDFEARAVVTKDVRAECDEGMMAENELCVPCQPGSFLRQNSCLPCPVGFFQPLSRQLTCLPCQPGTTSRHEGSTICKVCPAGSYGLQCKQNCSECVHGTCHPVTGQCVCESGWEGEACDVDTMGCTVDSCYPGVNCWDIRAPGTGFICGQCPEGTTGDGTFCEIIPFATILS
jgi:hypothetical protein